MDAQLERRLLACPALPTSPSIAGELLARCRCVVAHDAAPAGPAPAPDPRGGPTAAGGAT